MESTPTQPSYYDLGYMIPQEGYGFQYNPHCEEPWNSAAAQTGAARDVSRYIVNNVDHMFSGAIPRTNDNSENNTQTHNGFFMTPFLSLNNPVSGHDGLRHYILTSHNDNQTGDNSPSMLALPCLTSAETLSNLDFDTDSNPSEKYYGPIVPPPFEHEVCQSINPQNIILRPDDCYFPQVEREIKYNSRMEELEVEDREVEDLKLLQTPRAPRVQSLDPKGRREQTSAKKRINVSKGNKEGIERTSRANASKGSKENIKVLRANAPKVCKSATESKVLKTKKPRERLKCSYCQTSSFHNSSELKKHIQVKHERPFICTFSFAGCDQTFGSKNEWKRHVNSQHMHLVCWKCDLASCKDRHAVFNRKDLFGQHLKRMHQPQAPARLDSTYIMSDMDRAGIQEAREQWVRTELPEIQDRCYTVWREPPSQSNCEICQAEFTSKGSWDTKMEHVGKHYENGDKPSNGGPFPDSGLIRWALQHGLIEERTGSYEDCCSLSEQSFDGKDDLCSGFPPSRNPVENNCKYQFTKGDPFSPPKQTIHSWYPQVNLNPYRSEYTYDMLEDNIVS